MGKAVYESNDDIKLLVAWTRCAKRFAQNAGLTLPLEPWEYDILLTRSDRVTWVFKRDPRIRRPLGEVLWTRDDVPYLRPEVQLLLKARALRPKDQADFEAASPLLDPSSRAWLRESLQLVSPGHRWIPAL
jgi:hypothetical protein